MTKLEMLAAQSWQELISMPDHQRQAARLVF